MPNVILTKVSLKTTGVAFSKQDLGKRGMQEALQICENEQRVHGKHIQAIPLRPTAPVIK